jgi:hypothetical protein
MNIKKVIPSLFFAMVLTCSSQAAFASGLRDLDEGQQSKVMNGELVNIRVSKGANFPWPEFRFYQRVDAKPEEAVAVFIDYAKHKDYFWSVGLTQSDVQESNGPRAKIAYSLTLPLGFGSDHYTVENVIQGDFKTEKFQVSSNVIESENSYTDSHGAAYFEPMSNGTGTIVTYTSFVHPKERTFVNLAWGMIVSAAEQMQKDMAAELIQQIEHEKINEPALLKRQLENLRNTLENNIN